MSEITDEQFAELTERTQQLYDLTDTYAWKLYVDRCEADIELRHRKVLRGELSLEEYHRLTGWISGAEAMLQVPAIAQKQLETIIAERRATVEDDEEQAA